MRLLGDIATALLTADSPAAAVEQVYGALAQPLALDACLLYLPGADRLMQLHTSVGVPDAIAEGIRAAPPGQSMSEYVVERRRPMVVFGLDRSGDPRFELLRQMGLRSYMCYPLLGREYLVGALAFGSRMRKRFVDRDLELVRTVANLTALAIERSQLTNALMASESTLRTYYEAAPVLMGIVELTDGDDIVHIYDNPAAAAFFGGGSAPGMRASERGLPAETVSLWAEQYRVAERSGDPVRFEYVHETPEGPRWLRAVVTRIPGPSGRRPRFSYMAEDITDRRFAEESLRDADRRKDEFLAMLAHELRNPLAPIRFALRMLESGADSADAARARSVIDRQVSHLVRLVDDLLDVSRITRNKIQLRLDRISVAAVMQSAVESAGPVLTAAGHTLEVGEPRPDVVISADHARMVQVFTNLLNNASKFTPPGGHLEFAAESSGNRVDVIVRDNGVGIDPSHLPYLFELFQQGPAAREGSQGGLGIGLALARRLVEMHGGTIRASSEGRGRGAEFRVSLPVVHGAAREARDMRSTAAASQEPAPPAPMRVLVVDDNADSADMLAALVEQLDHDVKVAHDGPGALNAARAWRPKVALLDIGLPGLDGYEVARRLRADAETAPMLLVAITGWGQEDDRRRAREAGFDAHFTKPADPGALGDLLQSYAREQRVGPQTRHEDSRT